MRMPGSLAYFEPRHFACMRSIGQLRIIGMLVLMQAKQRALVEL